MRVLKPATLRSSCNATCKGLPLLTPPIIGAVVAAATAAQALITGLACHLVSTQQYGTNQSCCCWACRRQPCQSNLPPPFTILLLRSHIRSPPALRQAATANTCCPELPLLLLLPLTAILSILPHLELQSCSCSS